MSWFTALPFPRRRAFALSALVTVASGPLHAQVAPPPPHADEQDLPVTVRAEEIGGRPDREITLERDVEVTRGQTRLKSDTACYRLVEDEVSASGHVDMWRFGDRYQGDTLQLNMSTGRGYVTNPRYKLQMNNAQGQAERIDFLGENEALIQDGTYSTCEGPNPDWYLKASTLRLDSGRDVGIAGKTIIYFKDVPILGTPALSFSLSGARRSGWLPATVGFGSKGKVEVMVPYYFNIAPNRDLTVFPRIISDRGLQLGATARYIGETARGPYGGETHLEGLYSDRITDTNRWRVDSTHNQTLAPGWTYGWNLHAASDDNYPSDFAPTVATSAERQLVREAFTSYNRQYWSLTARVQRIQVLQEPAAVANPALAIPRPYDRLPQINFHTGRYDVKGFDWAFDAEATRFSHPNFPTFVSGDRLLALGQVSYPWVRPGYYVTPKLMLHATKYSLDNIPGKPDSLSRTLPTFSVDTGMVFERDTKLFGSALTQTLEPRLFYVKTPYRNQDDIPLFDTAETGFSYAQLFTENRYIGGDRVSDANQVTAALVSRYIESDGAERLRMAIAQRFYFSEPRVGRAPGTGNGRSDLLLAASGRIIDNWNFDSSVQYDATGKSVYAQNHGVRWIPGPLKVLNAEYRYVRDSFRNADVSAQWPLSARWFGVGRVSYSLRDHKVLESLVGLEYKADCWIFRMGAQRFVTAAQNTSTSSFFQLELNGLSRLGLGNPLDAFYKSIPGYTRLNNNVGRP